MTDTELTALWCERVMGWLRGDETEKYPVPTAWYYGGGGLALATHESINPLHSLDDAFRGFSAHPEWHLYLSTRDDHSFRCEAWEEDEDRSTGVGVESNLNRAIVLAQLRATGWEADPE